MSCSSAEIMAAQDHYTDVLLAKKNVIGTGCGDGYMAVYVEQKEPLERLANEDVIPAQLDSVPVKVVETGKVIAYRAYENVVDSDVEAAGHFPDARRGSSSGNAPRNITGTLGCYVRGADNTLYALSNNHVYAGQQAGPPVTGHNIVWPGPADNPQAVLGTLSAWTNIVFSTSANNRLDAAIAQVTNPGVVGGNHDYVGPPATVPSPGTPVEKHGRTTHFTTGSVGETNVTVVINFGGSMNARFVGQWTVPSGTFGNPGDSGSVVVRSDNKRPVGHLFAGGSTVTFMNPIHETFSHFNVTMDDNGEGPEPPEPPPNPCPNPDTVIDLVGSNSAGVQSTSVVYNRPSGVVEGDFLVATVSSNNQTMSAPSGWSLLSSSITGVMRNHVFTKVATGNEPSTYTFSVSSESLLQGGVSAWRGVDTDNPIVDQQVNTDSTNAPEPRTGPGVNVADAGRVLHLRQTRRGTEAPITFSTSAPSRSKLYDVTATGFGTAYSSALFADDCDMDDVGSIQGIGITASAAETHNIGRTIVLRAGESADPPPPPPECPERREITLQVSIDGDDVDVEVVEDSGPFHDEGGTLDH